MTVKLPKEIVELIYETVESYRRECVKLEGQCVAAQKVFTEAQKSLAKVKAKTAEYETLLEDLGLPTSKYPNIKKNQKEWDGEIPEKLSDSKRMSELAGV
jgi:hypothetical protein